MPVVPPILSKTEIPKYFLYVQSQQLIRKLKRKEEALLTIVSAIDVAVGTDVDVALGS